LINRAKHITFLTGFKVSEKYLGEMLIDMTGSGFETSRFG